MSVRVATLVQVHLLVKLRVGIRRVNCLHMQFLLIERRKAVVREEWSTIRQFIHKLVCRFIHIANVVVVYVLQCFSYWLVVVGVDWIFHFANEEFVGNIFNHRLLVILALQVCTWFEVVAVLFLIFLLLECIHYFVVVFDCCWTRQETKKAPFGFLADSFSLRLNHTIWGIA